MIAANWQAPPHIKAFTTIRDGGASGTPFVSNNFGQHVGDNPEAVAANRALLRQQLPSEPLWLEQVHSTIIVNGDKTNSTAVIPTADGAITQVANRVMAVMTADCLPLLICDSRGQQVAAVHAGWRGLANGIIEQSVAKFKVAPQDLMVWLGPAIGANAFEVGQDVVDCFVKKRPQDLECFTSVGEKYLANLYQLARARLADLGIKQVSGGDYCTYTQQELFFSYRRDGQTGRMVSLIWIESI
ncbi:MAG: peptidoglycan editing factor PgeF [Gammaproteobacteria bacterium]|nr:peptidoglycan editing factor PgeF [Gammaproteobacteria bacterium]